MSPKEPQQRHALASAAFTLFAERGLSGTTVEAICDAAGLDDATFRAHFADKDEIARFVLQEWSEAHLRRLHELEGQHLEFEQKVVRLTEERRQLVRELGPIMLREMRVADGQLAGFIAERRRENRERFTAFLVAAQERGEVRRDLPPEVMFALLAKLDELTHDPELVAAAGGVEDLTRAGLEIFFRGVLDRDG